MIAMQPERLKSRICETIDAHRDEIVALGEDIRIHPELGFKEFRTAALVSKHFRELGIPHLMPAIQASVNGCMGDSHGADYTVQNPDTAYILPAKAAAMTLVDLLSCGARKAQTVIANSQPVFTKASYLALLRELETREFWDGAL